MPGLRIMNSTGADSRDGENRKRTHDGKLVNGERTPRKDAPAVNGPVNASNMNGAVTSAAITSEQLAELPPEIVHLSSEFYHPLTRLLQRISQECFNDLNHVLQTMAEVPVSQHPNGVMINGLGGYANGIQDNSDVNKQKKLLLMKFAQENRAKFIKLLVLTEWGKKSSFEISKLIDLFQWTREQGTAMDLVDIQVEHIKLLTAAARQMNPDIRTALEVLSKGKAEWIPDLGFIPPEPISPEKALKLLRYMNTSLAIRLNVHENLPRHLKKWRIESGRATFVVDNEFELDVMSFTEDASEQWHFIDLRLLFSPAPSISVDSRFQGHFKPQVDYILKQSGLSGAYDFLHGFILTHKIAILKSQAYQLARAAWAGTIKVEPVHRSLVVQYWTDRPGRKSWIEIGVTSNKPKNGKISWRGAPISALTVRWFRHGIEVKNVDLKFDFANLSMERMLMKVISLHIGHFLKIGLAALPAKMTAKASFSETEPCDCTLEVSLGRPENKTTLSLEHVTGRYILRPCTSISARAEQAINQAKDPLAAISPTITQLLAQTLQDLIQRNALQLGWQPQPRHSLRSDIVKQATKLDILQYTLYWPSGWSMKWALAAVIDASGESWWLMELGGKGTRIEYAEPLSVERPGPAPAISRAMLASTERLAVQQLAFCVTRRDLEKHTIPSSVRSELSLRSSPSNMATQVALRGWVLHLRTSDLLVAKPGEEPWLNPTIWVTYQGFKADYRNVSHIASGTMVKAVAADMQKLMSASPQSNFTFSENGNFAILLTSPFGEPIIDELKARLRDVDRLRSFTTTLQKRKMKLKSSSLQQVQFQYGRNHTATVNFGQENDIQVTFGATNAHNRIRTFLAEIINDKTPFCLPGADKNGLDRFCSTLLFTRPLLSTFTELENSVPGNLRNPAVRAHHVGYYRVTYANPLCSFDIQLRPKEDKVFWHIEDNDRKQPDSRPNSERNPNHKRIESLKTALTTLFKGQGQGWLGIRSGILAEIDGVPDALKTLHQIVMSCHVEGGAPPVLENSSQVPATNSTGPASTNINPAAAPSNNTTRLAPPNSTTRPAPPNARPNFPNAGKQMKTGVKKQEVIELD